ncbi:ABC-three component system middle component 2 [Rhodococcus sp. ACPA1]|uniref:ABC-three component system middle component 2 n=1 Tax=Rhodococcus sp. ACPA1 TaxID=2028572 RepID=UPI0015CDEFE9|nr:ABC-three component system middle component 2 [Rhodococcus sp. ACPA1]
MPEDDVVFRLAQLLLLLESMAEQGRPDVTIERLSYYDFLVANPLLVVTEDDPDRMALLMAGFDRRALHYASPTHRFTTRRERLQHDLALLVSYGLVVPTVEKAVRYSVTAFGRELAGRFTAIYARAYRTSAEILIRRLHRMSDTRLREQARTWTTLAAASVGEPDGALFELELLGTDDPDSDIDEWPTR